ncbi:MAG: TonB-dependent receptor [Elusimicrobia bacterium]|nr:TonB-dependent receptor [Elusimicrobiota bacterium]
MKSLSLLLLFLSFPVQSRSADDVFFSVGRAAAYRAMPPADADTIYPGDEPRLDLTGLLDSEALLAVRRLNGPDGAATVSLRGFQAKQTAVYLDDVRLPADITGTVDLSLFPSAGLGRVEVLPGAASSAYGANAEGGVVHLFTRKLSPGTRLAEASAGLSSWGGRDLTFKTGASGRYGDFFLGAARDSSEGFQHNAGSTREAAQGRGSVGLGAAGKLTFSGLYSALRTGLPSGTPVPVSDWNGSRERAANSLTDWQKSRRGFLSGAWSAGGDDLEGRVESSLSSNRIEAFQFGSRSRALVTDRGLSGRLTVRRTLVLGAEASLSELASPDYGDHRLGSAGFFAQKTFSPAEKLELTPGARLDRSGSYPARLSPKLAAVYAPSAEWKFSASGGAGFQAPTFADLYNPWAAPAPGLKPEKSVNYDASAYYGSPDGWYASASGYYSVIEDRIALDPVTWAAANLDSGYNIGAEGKAGWKPGIFRFSAAWALNVSKVKTAGGSYELMNYSPLRKVTLSAGLRSDGSSLAFTGLGVSEQYTGRGRSGLRLPEYWVFGLRGAREIGGLEFWAAADNLLDRHYATTADVFNGWYPQPGRTFSAGLSWRLL